MHPTRSLLSLHPKQTVIVPAALVLSTALLLIGLSLPLMNAQTGILWARWENSYSVWTGIVALWHQHEYLLAIVLFLFSLLFPFAKLITLAALWWVKLDEIQRVRLLQWLELLGKWSMLDVFAVAIMIVLVKLGPLADIQPRSGVYFFAAAILSSMLTTRYVSYLAHHSPRSS